MPSIAAAPASPPPTITYGYFIRSAPVCSPHAPPRPARLGLRAASDPDSAFRIRAEPTKQIAGAAAIEMNLRGDVLIPQKGCIRRPGIQMLELGRKGTARVAQEIRQYPEIMD